MLFREREFDKTLMDYFTIILFTFKYLNSPLIIEKEITIW
ncbi:hypothetical protein LCGC14_0457360 [marine sediment metagenome]|uniref:Uncharacterized protein n=1 Tax=marine sediment metagenome TaxID=412755 RepID=A0A0F9V2Y9_9ZZZZ|nr:MAG: hypothetical protein Lokiarch_09350 [Candidatus Lokiarchaeum sp. GC14_75]